jgi:hypothetical protein
MFEAYLIVAALCAQWNTPDVFRTFAGVMQHDDAEVRRKAIGGTPTGDNAETVPGTFPALTNRPTRRESVRGKTPTPGCDRIQGTDNLKCLVVYHETFDEDLPELPTLPLYLRFFLAP